MTEPAGGGEGGILPTRGFDRTRGATAGGASSSVGILGPARKASEVVNVLLARHVEGVATLDSIELPILSEAALNLSASNSKVQCQLTYILSI